MDYSAAELFRDWYTQATKHEPSDAELTARQSTINRLLESDEVNAWLSLIRVFYGLVPENHSESQFVINQLKQDDPSLLLRNNYNLIRVIAGCAIAQKIESENSYLCDTLCLAILTSQYQGRVSEVPISDVIAVAKTTWLYNCEQARAAEGVINQVVTAKVVTGSIDIPTDATGGNYTTPATLNVIIEKTKGYLVGLATDVKNTRQGFDSLNTTLQLINTKLETLSEETNILWWLYSSFSRDFDMPFSTLGLASMCVIGPKELSDLTIGLPGLNNANALLYKSVQVFEVDHILPKMSFASIIEAAEPASGTGSWLSTFTKDLPESLTDFAPCLYALTCYNTYEHEVSWQSVFRKKGKFLPTVEVIPLHFMQQLYLELMLIRVFSEV